MFERNKIDNSLSLQQASVPAELELNCGRQLKGKFYISAARSIYEVLNGDISFLDFETYGGERSLIAKAAIKTVKIVSVAQAAGLQAKLKDASGFDPHSVLGVEKSAGWDDIRHAYLKLSKTYHPDRFASADLPGEVREYLSQMSRRVNAAYAALEAPQQAAKVAIEKAKPIYTSGPRI